MSGGSGDAMSREVHPGWSATLPLSSLTLNVTMPCDDGTAIQRDVLRIFPTRERSWFQLLGAGDRSRRDWSARECRAVEQIQLAAAVAATMSLSLAAKTSGDELKFAAATVAEPSASASSIRARSAGSTSATNRRWS